MNAAHFSAALTKCCLAVNVHNVTTARYCSCLVPVAAMADFYDSLNPEQQQKVRELMQRRKGWMARG